MMMTTSLKADIKGRALRLPLLQNVLHFLLLLIQLICHELRDRLLVNTRILFVALVEIRMTCRDDVIDFRGFQLSHNPADWDLPFELEYLPVLEGFVVLKPGVNRLKSRARCLHNQKK
jgi:hypothetical protein